jgi:hypothetical protein
MPIAIPLPVSGSDKPIRRIIDMQIRSVGIDVGKTTFHLVALIAAGKVLLRKKFTQKQLITFNGTCRPV